MEGAGGSAPLVLKKLFVGELRGDLKIGLVLVNVLRKKFARGEREHRSDFMIERVF